MKSGCGAIEAKAVGEPFAVRTKAMDRIYSYLAAAQHEHLCVSCWAMVIEDGGWLFEQLACSLVLEKEALCFERGFRVVISMNE